MVASGCASEPEIDAAGKQRFERAELLGDHEWRMIRQHDAAGANPNCFRSTSNVRHDNAGRGAGNTGHVVVFSYPLALVIPSFSMLREVERIAKRNGGGAAVGNG